MSDAAQTITLTLEELDVLVRRISREESGATPPPILTTAQVAEWLGVTAETVHTLVSRDGMPCVSLGPRVNRYEPTAVLAWARARGRNMPALPEQPARRHLRAVPKR